MTGICVDNRTHWNCIHCPIQNPCMLTHMSCHGNRVQSRFSPNKTMRSREMFMWSDRRVVNSEISDL